MTAYWHLVCGTNPHKNSETTERMTMRFLPDVKLSKEAWKLYMTCLVLICRPKRKNDFWKAPYRHANFTKKCRIINISVGNWSWIFQINIFKIFHFAEQSVKYFKGKFTFRKSYTKKYLIDSLQDKDWSESLGDCRGNFKLLQGSL